MITTVNADQVDPSKRILHIFRNDLYGFSFRLEEFLVFLTSPGFLSALADSRVYVWGLLNNGKSIDDSSSSGSEMSGEGANSKSQIADRKACGDSSNSQEEEDSDDDDYDEDETTIDDEATTDTATDATDEDVVIPPPAKKACIEVPPVVDGGDGGGGAGGDCEVVREPEAEVVHAD
jgi:hypothetical protein